MEPKINLVLVDDELLFRRGLKAILEKEDDIKVIFDAENGSDLLKKLKKYEIKPDIIVTDLKMPEINGVEVTKIIRKNFPEIKIIALTSYFSRPFILNMISLGAVAYLEKNTTPKLMIKTIKQVHKKGFHYGEVVLKFIHESIKNNKQKIKKSSFDSTYFSKRELQILNLICRQMTARDIANKLFLSPRTIEGHRNNLLIKTDSKNIAGLVIYALKNRLISLDTEI